MVATVGSRRDAVAVTRLRAPDGHRADTLTLWWTPAAVPVPPGYAFRREPGTVAAWPALYWPEAIGAPADVYVVPSVPWQQGAPLACPSPPDLLGTPARAALLACRAMRVPHADGWAEADMGPVVDVLLPVDATGCRRLPVWLFPCLYLATGDEAFVERNGFGWPERLAAELGGAAASLVRAVAKQTVAAVASRPLDLRVAPPPERRPAKRAAAGELLEAVARLEPEYRPATPLR